MKSKITRNSEKTENKNIDINSLSSFQVRSLAKQLSDKGRRGDTELAHVNPFEKELLKYIGGSGTINPNTGLREYSWLSKLKFSDIGKFGTGATSILAGLGTGALGALSSSALAPLLTAGGGGLAALGPVGWAAMAALAAGSYYTGKSAWKVGSGADWSHKTKGRPGGVGGAFAGKTISSYEQLKKLFGGPNVTGNIQDLMYESKYGGTDYESEDWGRDLGLKGGLKAFNPFKRVSEGTSKGMRVARGEVEGLTSRASQQLKELFASKDVGGPSVGTRDIFAEGARQEAALSGSAEEQLLASKKEQEDAAVAAFNQYLTT